MTNVTIGFFDRTDLTNQLVETLYDRLDDVRRTLAVAVAPDDEFNLGISCRATYEEAWLMELLDKVERSR
jgi:hypothetical protein